MDKENYINEIIEDFICEFQYGIEKRNLDIPEITTDIIKNSLKEFFEKTTLTEAEDYFYNIPEQYIDGSFDKVNTNIPYEERKNTPEYKAWSRLSDIKYVWNDCRSKLRLLNEWVKINGKLHTIEEAAKIAADKWCELIFDWHLQDNGALDQDHPGGFSACALATVLGNNAKEKITEEMKVKAYELFYEYYKRYAHYIETHDSADINWLQKTLQYKDYEWKYGFNTGVSCDYDPSYPLYIILYTAGIPDKDIRWICPWKTSIDIRPEDNAILYYTYQHKDIL